MIKQTQRDIEMIYTLDLLKVMTSKQLQRLFFYGNQGHQSRRCKQLVDHKKIKCSSLGNWQQNIYYLKRKPKQQLKSMLLLSEFYVRMIEAGYEILFFKREYVIPDTNIRADGFMVAKKDSDIFEFIIEIDLTHFDGYKYEAEMIKGTIFNPIVSISPYKRRYCKELTVYYINKDFININKFFKKIEEIC